MVISLLRVIAVSIVLGQLQVCAAECSSKAPEKFPAFVERFSSDKTFALERTIFPLTMEKWESGVDDKGKDISGPDRWKMSKEDFAGWPTLPEARTSTPELRREFRFITRTKVTLEEFLPNTDFLLQFHFVQKKGCWFFWKYSDRSL